MVIDYSMTARTKAIGLSHRVPGDDRLVLRSRAAPGCPS
jgi:hypothetical protein